MCSPANKMFKRIKKAFNTPPDHPSSGMADLAKSVPVAVSSSPPACQPLNQLTDAPSPPPRTPTSNGAAAADSFADMSSCFSDDGTSLQDLIDSELALRISADVPDDSEESVVGEPIPFGEECAPVVTTPVLVNGNDAEDDGDVNTRFIASERNHGCGDLTEADILFFNTFNQVQGNGDEFLSSPEVEKPPPSRPLVDGDGPILAGFDPFATIPPSQELESPVFGAAKPFPSSPPSLSPDDDDPPSFVTNDGLDVVLVHVVDNSSNHVVLVEDNRSCPTNTLDSVVGVINNAADVNTEFIRMEGMATEICSGETTEASQQEVVENGEEAPTVDDRLLTPEPAGIPVIGVTPPEEGTEYDEDAYYAELEGRGATPVQEDSREEELDDVSPPPPLSVDEEDPPSKEEIPDDVRPPSPLPTDDSPPPPADPAEEELDSWIKVDDVDFDRSDETEIEMAVVEPANADLTDDEGIEHVVCGDQPALCTNKPDSDSESSEAVTSSSSADKKSKKKKSGDGGDTKTKRNKKNKEGKENISVKSSFSKFDALQKKTVLHVRSVDASKVQKQFNQSAPTEVSSNCKVCGKQVFQMEQVKAERAVYHKNCFRCLQCSKQLTVDTYSSHEGQVYCKPHFKELFQPKVVIEDDAEPVRRRKPEMIIRENQPMELPPDVFRASDKPDLGLEELGSLNVKSRFQVFEKADEAENPIDKSPSAVNVKRSPSILSKLARFQAKGMDVGVTDDSLNGIPLEESSSSEESEEEEGDGDKEVVRANRKQRERPVSFGKMEDIKGRWETGTAVSKEERRQERKQEIQSIRSRLFMGHQGKMKEMYQQAVSESTNSPAAKKEDVDVCSERAKSIKERFERGEPLNPDDEEEVRGKKPVDEDLVDAGYSKKSRTLFLELDATAAKQTPISPAKNTVSRNESFKKPPHDIIFNRTPSSDVVRASDQVEDVVVETADIGNKFKFFETYKPNEKEKKKFRITPPRDGVVKEKTPEREIYRDPTIVRSDERAEEGEITRSQTASKMLSFFKHMEQSANKEELPQGPKPLKRFTPPPDSELNREDESSDDDESSEDEEEDEEDEHDPNIIRSSDKQEDEFLKQAATAARAKALRAKFERWEEKEIEREREAAAVNGTATEQGDAADQTSIDTTRSIRARFESMNSDQSPVKDKQARPKVNRFVEIQTTCAEFCASCEKKVYHLERVETGGKVFHKNCFRCLQCNCILRMDTYTLNSGRLYCIPHFKQIFFAKGNYEEGFGIDQHKRKWASNQSNDILLALTTAEH